MTLEDLQKQANHLRTDAVAFCDRVGFRQTSADLMIPLDRIPKTNMVSWARGTRGIPIGPSERAQNSHMMRNKILKLVSAIELYLYAKEHGVERAMIWKLSQ